MKKPGLNKSWKGIAGLLCFLTASVACEKTRTQPITKNSPATQPAQTQPARVNRLAQEKSPYLLQHAHNPVDWYPWSEGAFAKARRENKPIFLSIGYSTCHWCHVMERESFENAEVAKLLNDWFVSVKVDREERPDLDRVYMTYVQASTGSGGWPMTVLLTPELKPFFGGTYFPPEDAAGRAGLKTLLTKLHELWEKDPAKIAKSADDATRFLQEFAAAKAADETPVSADIFQAAYDQMHASYDSTYGGFGGAPKFPQPVMLNFLFYEYHRTGEAKARDMVLQTLFQMAQGGIHDHLGGGFHRYSTDQRWFLPHFEKMLYDQAQLAGVYLAAYQITREPFYADTVRDILDYVARDLCGESGQFYSAEDADSAADPARPHEKSEGAFYVWSAEEIARVLGPQAADLFNYRYGLEKNGNIANDPFGEFRGKNVLYEAHSVEETAAKFGNSPDDAAKILAAARQKLLAARNARPRPHLDDKTITAWNGLMISAFARAGPALEEPRYTQAAVHAADFIRTKLYDEKTHTLLRRLRDGAAEVPGFLDDYAFFIQGLLDLYESTLDIQWLKLALALQTRQNELFWDQEGGGYFTTATSDRSLLLRMKDSGDGAEPAGNSIAALNLLRLSQMTDDKILWDKADRILKYYSGRIRQAPSNLPQMLVAAEFGQNKPVQIVLAGKPDGEDTQALLREINRVYLPHRVILSADGGEGQRFLSARVEFLKTVVPLAGHATAYVCHNFTCQQPTSDPTVLRRLLTSD